MNWENAEKKILISIKDSFKIISIYLIIYLLDVVIFFSTIGMVSGNSRKVDILYSVVLFLGFILFLVMIKGFKITRIPIIIFLCILTFCLLVLTIDNKYFLYLEHGLDFAKTILPQELVIKSYLIGLPFLGVFFIMKFFGVLRASYYVIPFYTIIIIFIMIKLAFKKEID